MTLLELYKEFVSHQKKFITDIKTRRELRADPSFDFSAIHVDIYNNYAPVFVLSTGRSGTLWMTRIMECTNNLHPVHEPFPELGFLSKYAYESKLNNNEELKGIVKGARYELVRESFLLKRQYVETNNRLTFFAHQLAEIFPKSKFIHIVRNPVGFLKSGLSRNWYSGKELTDEARIIIDNPEEWQVMTNQQKILWLWNETNGFIENFKSTVSESRVLFLKSEEMFGNIEKIKLLLDFCGADEIYTKKLIHQASKEENKSSRVKEYSIEKDQLVLDIEKYAPLKDYYNYIIPDTL